jgi:adenylate cyclase
MLGFSFRTFRAQVLALFLLLLGAAQLISYVIVTRVHDRDANTQIREDLAIAARQFRKGIDRRNADLAGSARGLSFDAGLRDALSQSTQATLVSALASFQTRVDAEVVGLLTGDTGALLAETRAGPPGSAVYTELFRAADASDDLRATGYGMLDDKLFSFGIVPLRAPLVVAWIVVGFPIDKRFLDELKETSGVEISLRHEGKVLATTVTQPDEFVSESISLPLLTGGGAEIVLQYSLNEKLAPARRLEQVLLFVAGGTLLLAALAGMKFARQLSDPVQQLAAHTKHIAAGDYEKRIALPRADELGQLATAFNEMSAGLAERDRVRDLLDKNVSPEVAARLMRDGAALGGEIREVTVLFADLRGFTTMSERLPPHDLLQLLNRYLDRMSAEIERHGGIIDKFIGDEIMALFGAPVAQDDSAARALSTALAMERALAKLNTEFAAEAAANPAANLPKGLAVGIGINTARVVAGNMGSHRRLNYSVIGDGVNIAARLQSLTRKTEYRANIITSAATVAALRDPKAFALRPLGHAQVKGRGEAVEVFALDQS